MVIKGGGELEGANFVRDRAVVRPAMPPPKIVIRSGEVAMLVEGDRVSRCGRRFQPWSRLILFG